MPKKILWVDNDRAFLIPYVEELESSGYDVTVVTTLSKAYVLLEETRYDLFILDVMIPATDDHKDEICHTDNVNYNEGLFFYRQMKKHLKDSGTHVVVLTVRLDKQIKEEFVMEGLPLDCFHTKLALREVTVFLDKLKGILGDVDK